MASLAGPHVLNDAPVGTVRTYNGLRLAMNLLSKVEGTQVMVTEKTASVEKVLVF